MTKKSEAGGRKKNASGSPQKPVSTKKVKAVRKATKRPEQVAPPSVQERKSTERPDDLPAIEDISERQNLRT